MQEEVKDDLFFFVFLIQGPKFKSSQIGHSILIICPVAFLKALHKWIICIGGLPMVDQFQITKNKIKFLIPI